jgi:alpha-D-xyloside xylohydrolase
VTRIGIGMAVILGSLSALRPAAAQNVQQQDDGVVITLGQRQLKLQVWDQRIIRVCYSANPDFFARHSVVVVPRSGPLPHWSLARTPRTVTVSTDAVAAEVDLTDGAVRFLDGQGGQILSEAPGGRELVAASVQGVNTFHIRQQWQPNADESLYGLGQNQLGLVDLKGFDLDLWQHNGTIVVPFVVSSRGYGILWDNPSYSRFGDLRPFEPPPADCLCDASGKPGGLTGTYFSDARFENRVAQRVDQRIDITKHGDTSPLPEKGDASVRWEGQVRPSRSGDYQFQTFSNCGLKVWIGDRLVINHWRQGWLPWLDVARVHLEAGQAVNLKVEWTRDQGDGTVRLLWKPPPEDGAEAQHVPTSIWSEVGQGIDYYFVRGPRLDEVIGGYRRLTGAAPMPPEWAFGLWQSRQRYETSQQSLDVVAGFRGRAIPFDNIVQDWLYWKEGTWGSHQFDADRFPDPDSWIREIHDKYHAHLMISVWGKFNPGTENFRQMQAGGFLYERTLTEKILDWRHQPYAFFDAFNAQARKLFWAQMNKALFARGVDAWWMDATEPDLTPHPTLDGQHDYMNPTAMGPGSAVLNEYALMMAQTVYDGQRQAAPDQRVFILTRSGFAGQQRYAAASWSGDISSTWTAMRKQLPAGLSFCMSGVPYWTMDIGGFSVPPRFSSHHPSPADVDEWRELFTRWFQFGAFCPLLRVHGEWPYREMWEFGGEQSPAFKAQLKIDRLRYRLLPYIYSVAGDVTRNGGTMMRALALDFADDAVSRGITDEYLFGPSLLVSPVTQYQARSRAVYLPPAAGWYDFWTGARLGGGQQITAAAPFDQIPLHVRAGSIIPFGPELQFTGEKPADPITLFVYAGADGKFDLYEDDGLTYQYEKGAFSLIPIRWDDAAGRLTIGQRTGSFPSMLPRRTFNVVFVSKDKPAGFSFDPAIDRKIEYDGQSVTVSR